MVWAPNEYDSVLEIVICLEIQLASVIFYNKGVKTPTMR